MSQGNLFVISGPSGAGKGTLVARVLQEVPNAWVSVSATTRAPREGEVEGSSYFFMTEDEFQHAIDNDGFLEWARYAGNFYGTPRACVESHIAAGDQVILEIEVQGALQVRDKMPDAKLIFIAPPSLEELKNRLLGRGTETDGVIEERMRTAEVELSYEKEYDKTFVNDNLVQATEQLVSYIEQQANEL